MRKEALEIFARLTDEELSEINDTMRVMIYVRNNGGYSIRWPKGSMPDRETLEAIAEAIKKAPAPCSNTEQGTQDKRPAEQEDSTTEE